MNLANRIQANPSLTPVEYQVANSLSIDLEDWPQAYLNPELQVSNRFEVGVHRILNLLDEARVKATFFVLGLAAEKSPHLIRELQTRGHEVQSHGFEHRLIHMQTLNEFRRDIERSKKQLEDLCGRPIRGYRAPGFSITRKTLWALDILVEAGFHYDSSVFPRAMPRYGISGALRFPHRAKTQNGGELVELPVATTLAFGTVLPTGGGGYFRWLPYWLIRRGLQQHSLAGKPSTLYVHPHEFDPDEFRAMGYNISWMKKVKYGFGRQRIPGIVKRLLHTYRFQTMGQVVASIRDLPICTYAPLPNK